MKPILTLLAAGLLGAKALWAGDAPLREDFFEVLRLPPLKNQLDRFQIYDSPNEESLLHNLSNNRQDDFGVLSDGAVVAPRSVLAAPGGGAEREIGLIKVRQDTTLPLTALKTKLDVPDPYDQTSPQPKKTWTADEQVRFFLPEVESLFVFGQVKGGGDLVRQTDSDFTGKTGVGVKWSPLPATELQLRTGRQLVVSDFSTASSNTLDRSQFLVEVLAKLPVPVPLIEGVQLEYTGSAISAATSSDRSIFKQDLRVVLPAGKLNEFYIGVKYKSDNSNTPWLDRSEIYIGLTIKH